MLQTRVIPVLLLHNNGLYKTVKFKNPEYVGDPINAVKIFNDKEVDELIFLDIDASKYKKEPDYLLIENIASECFMPLCYGGGITNIEQIKKIFSLGVEKVSLNYANMKNIELAKEAIRIFGSQSIVGSMDINKTLFGKLRVYDYLLKRNTNILPLEYAKKLEDIGVGELLINTVYNDGVMQGYDVQIFKDISSNVNIPVIACGGAGSLEDCKEVVQNSEVSATGVGSMFVFHGKHKAVLITYPERKELEILFKEI